jgi:hypothetical protein
MKRLEAYILAVTLVGAVAANLDFCSVPIGLLHGPARSVGSQ